MPEWMMWITRLENSKIVALLLFFVTFCGILLYVYSGKQRSRRLESYKYIPLQDDETHANAGDGEVESNERSKS
jgi:cbb3-type cytochrome oxidase subunit 3